MLGPHPAARRRPGAGAALPAPLVPAARSRTSSRTDGRMNLRALAARWESVPPELLATDRREQHDRLVGRFPDVTPLQLVAR